MGRTKQTPRRRVLCCDGVRRFARTHNYSPPPSMKPPPPVKPSSSVKRKKKPNPLIGRAMRKRFADGIVYRGWVKSVRVWTLPGNKKKITTELYKVAYEDGDSEELEPHELSPLLYMRTPEDMSFEA